MEKRALLLGPEFPELARIGVHPVGPGMAVAISCGFYPKRTPALDGNEDAVAGIRRPGCDVMLVADGHYGFDAARAAITAPAQTVDTWIGGEPEGAALAGMHVAAKAVTEVAATLAADPAGGVRRHSATALGIAVVKGASLGFALAGDVSVILVAGRRASVIGERSPFLALEPPHPVSGERSLAGVDAVIVASDGLTDFLGRRWQRRLPQLVEDDAPSTARRLVEIAGEGGAGDNVAVAVLLLAVIPQ